jgi:hypothetical protein
MGKNTSRTPLIIPPELFRQSKAKATLEGTSVSALVRAWLQLWVAGEIPTPHAVPAATGATSTEGQC